MPNKGKGPLGLTIDTKDFEHMFRLSDKRFIHAAVTRATPLALNKARRMSQTRAARMAVNQKTGINLPMAIVKSDIKQQRPATKESFKTGWRVRDKPRNAIRSKSTRSQKQGLKYKPWKGGAAKVLKRGFIGNAGRTAFVRDKGAKRLPISPVFMPSTKTYLRKRGRWARLQSFAAKIIDKEIPRLVELRWNRMFNRAGLKNRKAG